MAFFDVCYSPYRQGNHPPPRPVSEAEVSAVPGADCRPQVHSYSHLLGGQWKRLERAGRGQARTESGPRRLGRSEQPGRDQARIDAAWKQAESQPGTVFHLVVGNEVNRRDAATWNPGEIRDAMAYARTARGRYPGVPQSTPVTTCFSGTVLQYQGILPGSASSTSASRSCT